MKTYTPSHPPLPSLRNQDMSLCKLSIPLRVQKIMLTQINTYFYWWNKIENEYVSRLNGEREMLGTHSFEQTPYYWKSLILLDPTHYLMSFLIFNFQQILTNDKVCVWKIVLETVLLALLKARNHFSFDHSEYKVYD